VQKMSFTCTFPCQVGDYPERDPFEEDEIWVWRLRVFLVWIKYLFPELILLAMDI